MTAKRGNRVEIDKVTSTSEEGLREVCTPVFTAEIAGNFTYASYQNAVPVLRSVEISHRRPRSKRHAYHVVFTHRDLLEEPDPTRELAGLPGLVRLAKPSRPWLDEAIERARAHLAAQLPE